MLEELSGVEWNVVAITDFRRTGEALKLLNRGHMFYEERKEFGADFFIHSEIEGKQKEFNSISETVETVVIEVWVKDTIRRCYVDEDANNIYEEVELELNKVRAKCLIGGGGETFFSKRAFGARRQEHREWEGEGASLVLGALVAAGRPCSSDDSLMATRPELVSRSIPCS